MPRPIRLIFAIVVGMPALQPSMALAQGTYFLKSLSLENGSVAGLPEQQARWLVKVDKPETLKGIPKKLGNKVYYYSGEVAGKQILALLDSGKTRTLYIDLDGDGDLSDEEPVTGKRARSALNFGWTMAHRFGPLSFASASSQPAAKKDKDAPFSGVFLVEQLDIDYLVVRPATCRRGVVRIGEIPFSIYLTDGNFNGRYDDVCKFPLSRGRIEPQSVDSDFIAIDMNRNGAIDYDDYGPSETQPLTSLLQFRGTYYSIQVTPDGSSITLDPAKLDLGTLDIGGKQNAEMLVRSENGMFHVSTQAGQCMLPAGKYRVWTVVLHQRDDKKLDWTLSGRASDKKPCEFEITADKITAIKIGAPFAMQTTERSHRTLLSGRVVSFGASCVDGAGIEYQAGAICGKQRSPAPSVKIVDEAGKTLSIGQFEYG